MWNFAWDVHLPFTFWAGVVGGMFLNMATHGADQMMIQRYLSARSQRQASAALIASGVVVFAQFTLFLGIGAALWVRDTSNGNLMNLKGDAVFVNYIIGNLPVGVLGLVVAALLAAAMSTLSSSLSSSSAALLRDFLQPISRTPRSEESWMRTSRRLTILFGCLQMAVAWFATGLQESVVNNALAIASFVTGIILGIFCLGLAFPRVGKNAALVGMVCGLLSVTLAKFVYAVAWPWFALIGSFTVVVAGNLAVGLDAPERSPANPSQSEDSL